MHSADSVLPAVIAQCLKIASVCVLFPLRNFTAYSFFPVNVMSSAHPTVIPLPANFYIYSFKDLDSALV